MFFSPHLLTLPVHSTLTRNQRQKFGIPCLAAGIIIIVLALPAALVPYYLLPEGPSSFSLLPADDGWVNCARVLMAVIVLGSITMWLLRGRDTILAALGVESGAERNKASRWVGMGMWAIVVGFACIGGAFADKMEILGVIATIAVGWLLPCKSLPTCKADTSRLLHHHVPRPLTTSNHLPITRSTTRSRGRPPLTPESWKWAHSYFITHRPNRRRTPSTQGATTAKTSSGATTMAGFDSLRGNLTGRLHQLGMVYS